MIYFPANSGAKEPQNLPNHGVVIFRTSFRRIFKVSRVSLFGRSWSEAAFQRIVFESAGEPIKCKAGRILMSGVGCLEDGLPGLGYGSL